MEITIKGIEAETIIGAHAHERRQPQPLRIDLSFEYDATVPVGSDRLADAIDYQSITNRAVTFVGESRCRLLETLVSGLLDLLLKNTLISRATVTVDKPQALSQADSVSVKGTRART